jgi:hypothetical protein
MKKHFFADMADRVDRVKGGSAVIRHEMGESVVREIA